VKVELPAACGSRFVLLMGCCLIVGCGGGGESTYPVTGKVAFSDGSTLKYGGEVVFISTDLPKRVRISGFFGPDGNYSLTSSEGGDGAVAASYEIAVFPTVPDDDTDGMTEAEVDQLSGQIDAKFSNPSASGLKLTVSAGASPQEFNIEVTKSKKRKRARR